MVAIGATALGLFQTYVGWLSFEAQWIREQAKEFSALMVGDNIVRPFAFFASPVEFAGYLSIAFICCCVPLFVRRFTWSSLFVVPIGYMLFLASVRTAIILTAIGALVTWMQLDETHGRSPFAQFSRSLLFFPASILGYVGFRISALLQIAPAS